MDLSDTDGNNSRSLWRGLQKRISADGREKLLQDFTETFSDEEDLKSLNDAFAGVKKKKRKVPFEIELATEYICAGRHGRPMDFTHSKFAVRIRRIYHSTGWKSLIIGGCSIHTLLLLLDVNMHQEDVATIVVSVFFATLYIIDAAAYLVTYRWPQQEYDDRKVDRTDVTWAILRLLMALAMIIDSMVLLDREECSLSYCFLTTDSLRPLVGVFRMRHVRNIFVGAFVEAPRRLFVIGGIIAGQILWAGVFGWLLLANPDYRKDDKPNTMSDTIGGSMYQFLLLFMCPPELFKIEGPFMDSDKVIPATLLTVTFIVLGRLFLYRLITASAVGAFKAQLKRNVMLLLTRRKDGTINAYRLLSRVSKRNKLLARAVFEGRAHMKLERNRGIRHLVSESKDDDDVTKSKDEDEDMDGVTANTWRQLYVYFKGGNGFFGTKRLCCNDTKGSITRSKLKACADAFFAVVFRQKIMKLSSVASATYVVFSARAREPHFHPSYLLKSLTSHSPTIRLEHYEHRYVPPSEEESKSSEGAVETKFAEDSVQWKKALGRHVATFAQFCELCYFLDVQVHRISRKNKRSLMYKLKSNCARPRMFVRRIIESSLFRGAIDVLVVLSIVQICAASNLGRVGNLVDNDDWLWVMGFALMWFFVLEITLKVFAYGPKKLFLRNEYEDSKLKYKDDVAAAGTLLNWLDLVTVLSSFMSYYIPNFSSITLVPHFTKAHSQIFRALYALRIFRLARLIKRVATPDMQKHLAVTGEILPAAARALAVYATIIFFFANIGHGMFRSTLTDHSYELCNNTLTSSSTPPMGFDVKDVTSWCGLRKELHFGSFAASLLTMFTVASFGNWKIVMEAAVAAKGTVTLVLPVLIGYLIQIYIAAYARHWTPTTNGNHNEEKNKSNCCCFFSRTQNEEDEEEEKSPSAWRREMRAVTQAMNHRRRLKQRRRQEGPDVRHHVMSSSSSDDDDDSSSDDNEENLNVRKKRAPRMSWRPGYGEFQIALFDDLMDKALPSSKASSSQQDDHGMEYYRNAFQRTAGELAAAQVELEELRSLVTAKANNFSSSVMDSSNNNVSSEMDESLVMGSGMMRYSSRDFSQERRVFL